MSTKGIEVEELSIDEHIELSGSAMLQQELDTRRAAHEELGRLAGVWVVLAWMDAQ